jgi:succinate-acetate transporter protein
LRDNQSDKIEKKRPNPKNIALFGAAATVLTIINMSTGNEPPSQGVIILQYAALAGALIALVAGLIMMTIAPK